MKVKDLFAALEEKDLSTLKQITASIKTFDRQKSLKRSKTFDRSALTLDLIKIPMSIQHFDHGSLRHVNSVDKSSPMHIYQMLRSESSYFNYLETPVNIASDSNKEILSDIESNLDHRKTTENGNSLVNAEKSVKDNTALDINKVDPDSGKSSIPNDISQTINDTDTTKYACNESVENLNLDANNDKDPSDTANRTLQADQGNDPSNPKDVAIDKSQVLLNGSYVVVTDNSDNLDNPVSEEMDTSTQRNTSEGLNTGSNISQLLVDYDKISIDLEKVLEKDPGKSENDIDGISMCSNLTTEEVVIGACQSDVNSEVYQKVVSTEHHSDKGDMTDPKVSEVTDNQLSGVQTSNEDLVDSSQDTEPTNTTNAREFVFDVCEEHDQTVASDSQKNIRDVESLGSVANDITEMIDDALLESNIDEK